jgi:transposase
MVWAEISNNRRTNLVRVQGNLTGQCYKDDILQQHILNVIDRQREIFQQDNARLHTARETMDFLTQNNINVLPWPSMSSDMNPKSWIELYRPVRQRQPPSQ